MCRRRFCVLGFVLFLFSLPPVFSQGLSVKGDPAPPSAELLSSIWWRPWHVGDKVASTLEIRGGSGSYVWTFFGNVPPGLRIQTDTPPNRVRILAGFTASGTYSVGILVVDTVTQDGVTVGPYDVVVKAPVDHGSGPGTQTAALHPTLPRH